MSCCLSLLIVSMDATIVNVAIPSIRADLGASASQLQWVIDIYTLALASLLMLSGATGDRFGRRRTFQIGLTVFALGSLLCSLAPNIETLIAARLLQAIGGSMMNPVALSIISQVFTGRVERARTIGIWGGVFGISMALGPIVGGALIELINWRAVFWINLPICALAILLTAIFVPESKSETMRNIDPIGQGLAVLFLFGLVFTLIEGPVLGWTHPRTLTVATVAALAFIAFLRFESRRHDPFIDLRFFRSIPFASATLTAISAFCAWGAFLFMMSLYLQDERGFSAMHTGLIYLPIAIGAADLFAAVRTPCGALRRPPVAVGGRRPDHRGIGDVDVPDVDHPGVGAGDDLRRLRYRVRNGERADHQCRGERDAARPCRCRVSGDIDEPTDRREYRCGSVRFGRGYRTGGDGLGLRRCRPPAVGHLRGARCGDLRARFLRNVGAGAALGRPILSRWWQPMSRNPLADNVWRAMAALVIDNRDSWRRAVVEQTGLPFSRIRILKRLNRQPMTVKQVAQAATIDAPAATVAVNDLEARGLVVRETDPANRRCKVVSLTDAGRDVVRQIDALPDPAPEVLASLSDDELKALRVMLDKLAHS